MNQRIALTLAAALTAFVLVVVGGLASRLSQTSEPTVALASNVELLTAAPTAAQIDPATEGLIKEREAAYQKALDEANTRLQQANAQIVAANQRLEQPAVEPAVMAAIVPVAEPAKAAAPAYAVTAEQAQAIAQEAAAGAGVTRAAELVSFQGVPSYEVGFGSALIYVDAQSGVVLLNGVASAALATGGGQISADQATQAALAYLGGGRASSTELREEGGVQVYVVTLADGSMVYVDPATGQVVYAEIVSSGGGGEHEDGEHEDGEHEGGEHDD